RAEMLLRLDEAKEAQQCYVRVLKEYEQLARDDPGNTELQNSIMANRYGLATACLEGGNVKTGLEECRKLLRYWESWLVTYPKNRNTQSWVMLCSARSGDWARATGLAEEFRRQRPKDAGNLVLVAQG